MGAGHGGRVSHWADKGIELTVELKRTEGVSAMPMKPWPTLR